MLSQYKIYYGTFENKLDVTEICELKLSKKGVICIPDTDHKRAGIFTDPVFGTLKSIFVSEITSEGVKNYVYNHGQTVYIDTNEGKLYTDITAPSHIAELFPSFNLKLYSIQNKLQLDHGSFDSEVPEQLMAVRYITGNEKVLEIGGNIGRNSLIIGHILNSVGNSDMVSLESDPAIAEQLRHNRDINGLKFHVEPSALSLRKLIQKGWDTLESDVVLPGYKEVDTINLEQLNQKYNIKFDTLVLDCEGAFYYILLDMPEILNGVNLIIMENDYWDINKKNLVDRILKNKGFYVDYTEGGGWGPCQGNFFEVWKRKSE